MAVKLALGIPPFAQSESESTAQIKMTPGIDSAKKSKIDFDVHEYMHVSTAESYGAEAAEKLGVAEERVFKTLVLSLDSGKLAVAILPVCMQLSMKLLAKSLGAKKASMAAPMDVQRSTGYVLGGVSPLGQKKRLPTVLHSSAQSFATIYISAGRRGLEIELKPADLLKLTNASMADIASN